MWKKPWKYKEGVAVGGGLLFIGGMLQLCAGDINWDIFAWPVNIYATCAFLVILIVIHMLRKQVYLFSWLSQGVAAVCALLFALCMTVVMGLVRQGGVGESSSDPLGFTQMVRSWPFVLVYLWLTVSLGLVILNHGFPRGWRTFWFQLNHVGLFIALVAATMGNADMLRLKMTTHIGDVEWRGVDDNGIVHELPLAIELREFSIDEYPPKLMIISNLSGKTLPEGNPQHLLLEEDIKGGKLLDWEIEVLKRVPMAAMVATKDTVNFKEFHSMGGCYASYLQATNCATGETRRGWVSNGSFLFPYRALHLDEEHSIIMPEREPRRYSSSVRISTEQGEKVEGTVEVNRPIEIRGWKIYQLSYDESKGRWSDISIFEIVRDPWLPIVYAGIFMMMAGALSLIFIRSH